MRILITGTPGTGKTTLAKKIAKIMKLQYLNWTSFVKSNKLYEKHDKKNKEYIVNPKKVAEKITSYTHKGNWIIDGFLSYNLKKRDVDLCIITVTELKELKKRLVKRKYSKQKIKDNLESETFEDILIKCRKKGFRRLKIDTTKNYNINKIIRKIKTKINKD